MAVIHNIKPISNVSNETCCKKVKHSMRDIGVIGTSICGKKATHINGSHYFCAKHARVGRYVVRDGDVGKILARFDTEEELRSNIHLYPGMRMQHLTKSHRRDIY